MGHESKQTTLSTDLTELWDAMGEAGIRPDGIELYLGKWMYKPMLNVPAVPLRLQHALDILTGHAERWLLARYREEFPTLKIDIRSVKKATNNDNNSLPAAIRAECGRRSR